MVVSGPLFVTMHPLSSFRQSWFNRLLPLVAVLLLAYLPGLSQSNYHAAMVLPNGSLWAWGNNTGLG